jgi:hypothetical protein
MHDPGRPFAMLGVDTLRFIGVHIGMSTPDQSAEEKLVRAFQYAAETRRFEIERFWQRSLFFWGFIAAAFISYANLTDGKYDPHLRQLVTGFGLVSSFAWTLQNRGSKYWQEAWEQKVERLELEALGFRLFGEVEPRNSKGPWGAWRYSASKITSQMSDFTVFIWIALGFSAFFVRLDARCDFISLSIATISVVYCIIIFFFGRSQSWRETRPAATTAQPYAGDAP